MVLIAAVRESVDERAGLSSCAPALSAQAIKCTPKDHYGRDHHPRCFTMWLAGGGVKSGVVFGQTDDFSYNIVENPVHIGDFHATILRLLGLDHRKFTFKWQGVDMRLTGVDAEAEAVKELLA